MLQNLGAAEAEDILAERGSIDVAMRVCGKHHP